MSRLVQYGMAALLLLASVALAASAPVDHHKTDDPQTPVRHPSQTEPGKPVWKPAHLQGDPADKANSLLVDADNAFGFHLLDTLLKQQGVHNTVVSPYSIAQAFQMAYNGAKGSTQKAMAQTLQLKQIDLKALDQANGFLSNSLDQQVFRSRTEFPVNPMQLRIANALFTRQGAPFNPDFIQRNRDYFSAEVASLTGGAEQINDWVSKQTSGKISQIANDQDLTDAVAILINAIYFKGGWSAPFNPQKTMDWKFKQADGTLTTCRMMHQTYREFSYPGKVDYLQGDHFQMIALDYIGSKLNMMILLPDKSVPVDRFVSRLTQGRWRAWEKQLYPTEGELFLPRFHAEWVSDMEQALSSLGMGIAFTQGADFSRACPELYISRATHKVLIDVDEKGSEAATAMIISVFGGKVFEPHPHPHFKMIVDHPFLFFIADSETKLILFAGVITDPKNPQE